MNREPVAIANAVAALVETVLILAIAFGLDLTPEQMAGTLAVIIAVGQTAATLVGRSKVSPVG